MFSGGIEKKHGGCNGLRKNIMRIGLKEWFAANEIKTRNKDIGKTMLYRIAQFSVLSMS